MPIELVPRSDSRITHGCVDLGVNECRKAAKNPQKSGVAQLTCLVSTGLVIGLALSSASAAGILGRLSIESSTILIDEAGGDKVSQRGDTHGSTKSLAQLCTTRPLRHRLAGQDFAGQGEFFPP